MVNELLWSMCYCGQCVTVVNELLWSMSYCGQWVTVVNGLLIDKLLI